MIVKYHAAADTTRLCDAEWLNCVSPNCVHAPDRAHVYDEQKEQSPLLRAIHVERKRLYADRRWLSKRLLALLPRMLDR